MSPFTIVAAALFLGIVVATLVFGAPVVAVPIFLVGVVVLAALDWRRKREQAGNTKEFREEAKAEEVEFTARDKQTLAS